MLSNDEITQYVAEHAEEILAGEMPLPRGFYYHERLHGDLLHLDYETKSDADLTKVGLDRYTSPSSNPSVLMAAYSINDGRTQHWESHRSRIPAELREALLDPEVEKWAFNAQFERVVTRRLLGLATPLVNWRCSMALAYMHSFTGGLADVGEQTGLPELLQKGSNGKKLIRLFTMPQRITKNQPHLWRNWLTDPESWEEFCAYNVQDNDSERALRTRLIGFPVPNIEWDFYELDQEINDRGIPIDMQFVENLIWMAAKRKAELTAEMREITGVANPNSGQQLLPWLRDKGYPYNDLQKESVEKAIKRFPKDLSDEDAPEVLRVLRRRQWASKTSTSKANTAKLVVGDDNRARYLFQFGGASRTNRFSGRLIQTQNMMRTPKIFDPEHNDEKLSFVTDLIRYGDYYAFNDLFIDEPMVALTGCMRGMLRAEEDYEFVTADLRSIESAVLGWMTDCERLLEVFRSGRDPYLDFGQDFYRKPYEAITRAERQICKPPALGCGYRLSAGKNIDGVKTGLMAYAENMGVEMTFEEADHAVKTFRRIYPEVKDHWYAYEAAVKFVLKTHKPFKVGPVAFKWMKPYLLIELPSRRCIYYYKPRLEKKVFTTGKITSKRVRSRGFFEDGAQQGEWITVEEPEIYERTVLTYMGRNQKNAQWTRIQAHGGVTMENIDQAISRDILRDGMMMMHKLGFFLVGHAHDETMAEERVGDKEFTLERMLDVFKQVLWWAPGLPLGAAGWKGAFYRK